MASPNPPISPTLESRYRDVLARVADAAKRAGRRPTDIVVCAVTKYADPEQIRQLVALGHRDFAENRVQVLVQHAAIVDEFFNRQRILPTTRKTAVAEAANSLFDSGAGLNLSAAQTQPGAPTGVRWHMIGHLQRNKARKVVDLVRLVHSVDSLRLAEELQHLGLKKDVTIECLLQVNCSGESSKFGCPIAAAIPLGEQILSMANVRLRGLMTMAAEDPNPAEARLSFSRCRDLFEEMRTQGFDEHGSFNILSMGMSNDYEHAIAEGGNIVRIGSAIFGSKATGPEVPEVPEPEEAESDVV